MRLMVNGQFRGEYETVGRAAAAVESIRSKPGGQYLHISLTTTGLGHRIKLYS